MKISKDILIVVGVACALAIGMLFWFGPSKEAVVPKQEAPVVVTKTPKQLEIERITAEIARIQKLIDAKLAEQKASTDSVRARVQTTKTEDLVRPVRERVRKIEDRVRSR